MQRKATGFASEKLYVTPPYILEEVTQSPLTSGAYITDIGVFPNARHHYRERLSGCDSHIFIYCAKGAGWLRVGDKDSPLLTLSAQQLAFIPAETPHSYGADEDNPWTIYWFHLRGELILYFLEQLAGYGLPITFSDQEELHFLEQHQHCYDLMSAKSFSQIYLIQVSQMMQYALSTVLTISTKGENGKTSEHIDKAIRYLNLHLEDTLTLDKLAQHVQLSRQHLNHLFKQRTGYSPIDYYLRLKVQRACQLLDLTSLTVKEIAGRLGFKDAYYFSRLFKQIIGSSPSSYRLQQKG